MNSARSRPTPSTGKAATSSARSAIARLTYSFVASGSTLRTVGDAAVCTTSTFAALGASATPSLTWPLRPSIVTSSPSRSTRVASRAPTMQGIRSSRLTIAAWQVMPPESVTMPAARRMVGTQSGEVIGATKTSPACSCAPWSGVLSTRTLPLATPGEAPRPVTSTVPTGWVAASVSPSVVIGLVWTR